jgi:hypothetical protein
VPTYFYVFHNIILVIGVSITGNSIDDNSIGRKIQKIIDSTTEVQNERQKSQLNNSDINLVP